MLSRILAALTFIVSLNACMYADWSPEPLPASEIGKPLEDMSSLNDEAGNDVNRIAIYDPTVMRIHQFNTDSMNIERSFAVLNPELPHNLLYNMTGNYIIDFTTKNISIFDRDGNVKYNPLRFVGTPVSAAFRPSLGILVVYDSLMSVGMLKLDGDGRVTKSWKGGPDLGGNRTIAAGDLDDGGRLVLALSDGSLVKIDAEQTMAGGAWTTSGAPVATGLSEIVWLAPVRGQADQVLVATNTKLALFNTASGAQVGATVDIGSGTIWRSKGVDAHVLTANYHSGGLAIHFVEGGQLRKKDLKRASPYVTHSRLDLQKDNLTFVNGSEYKWAVDALGSRPQMTKRMIRQWRFSDLDARVEEVIEPDAKLQLAANSLFALKPNKLGWALNYDLFAAAPPKERRGFNVPYIR